ncbi:GNAT family N-acetyltransferase [Roseateles violae]|uniref:GNAT family acetyltransferase n=1 Tax=Roseateles violae TaxID=3058042 RepID=A0ABT8DZ06_9BURK|nr:GNAT family N-acetyltransferase [Pelomonas sp. PFR6]MDN3922822.1 GNAT family acetyltransferase [Pelomonas sp. PFR6]
MDSGLFSIEGGAVTARALAAADVPALQRFFEANPDYFVLTGGAPPGANEAQSEMDDLPPAGMSYTGRWVIGFADAGGGLQAMASLLSDFLAPRVWHLGLFIAATSLHGSGRPQAFYDALERWMNGQGAQWLRLGVVIGNARAERFWHRQGFVQTRERGPLTIGQRQQMLRVMVKPLAGGTPAQYLTLVARDRPGEA